MSLFSQIFKAVATIRGQEKYKHVNIYTTAIIIRGGMPR